MNPSRRSFLAGTAGIAALAALHAAPRAEAQAGGESASRPEGGGAASEPFLVRSADGTRLSGEVRGDPEAPELLFVHGLRQSRLSWEKQLSDPRLAGFRLAAFDLRGHGDSDKPAEPQAYAELDRWAEDLAAVIGGAGLRRPVLVGWSLGGFVAGAYLRKYGGSKIAGINLVAAVTKLSPELLTEEAAAFTQTTMSHDLATRTAATADFLAACFHRPPTEAELHRMLVVNGMAERAVTEGIVRTEDPDLEPFFAAYEGPILLTHGRHDRLVRLAMSERIEALHANSRLSVFPDSGHSSFYEEPTRYGQELADFVRAANGA